MNTARRVAVITDCEVHLGPDLALELARRDHDLVLGQTRSGLVEQVRALGSRVVAVDGVADLTRAESVQTLVDAALDTFGRLDSACIRTGRIVVLGAGRVGDVVVEVLTEDLPFDHLELHEITDPAPYLERRSRT